MKLLKYFLVGIIGHNFLVTTIKSESSTLKDPLSAICQLTQQARQLCMECDGTPDFNEFCSLIKSINCVKSKLDMLTSKLAGLIKQAGGIITEQINFQTNILCKQIEEIDGRLLAKTILVVNVLKDMLANITQQYENSEQQILQVQLLESDASREQTTQLRNLSVIIAQAKQQVCIALLNAQNAITTTLIESNLQITSALDSNSEIQHKTQELIDTAFEDMTEINNSIMHSGQIIPLQIHESLSKIQVQLIQVVDVLLAAIAHIGYGNIDLIDQQVARVQGSINKYSNSYAQQFVKVAQQEGLQANNLQTELVAIQNKLIAEQAENSQLVVSQAAIDNTVLVEHVSKAQNMLTSFVYGVCSVIDSIQINAGALICEKEADIVQSLVKACNYLALCIAEVNEEITTLMVVNKEQTENLLNVQASQVASSIDTVDAAVLGATGQESALLQKVDVQISQVICAKVSNLETAQIRSSNQLTRSIASLQTNISKQVCQEISDATKNLTLQQEVLCAKMEKLNADISGLLLDLTNQFQNNQNQTEATLCSRISAIQADLSNQVITDIDQMLTNVSLGRNNFEYTINSQANSLAHLLGTFIQAHNANMNNQFQILGSKFCSLEGDLAMQQLEMTSTITSFQENVQENILQTKEEIIGSIENRQTAITAILLSLALLGAGIHVAYEAVKALSFSCPCVGMGIAAAAAICCLA